MSKSKKGAQPEPQVMMGRPGNNVKIGIVGLPNIGKSTLFNTLTKQTVPAENFPFCTIDPSEARCQVPDERYEKLVEFWKPASRVPAFLTVTDIAGLVKGAHEGQGLGNAFLSHIRAVDAIFHVTRAFEDEDVVHVEDSVDPGRDLAIITNELIMKDIEFTEKMIENTRKANSRGKPDKTLTEKLACWDKVAAMLKENKPVRLGEWRAVEVEFINELQLISAKPVVYLVNLSERDYIRQKNKHLVGIKQWIDENSPGDKIIPFSGALEAALVDMSPEEAAAYCTEHKTKSILPKIITTGYDALKLIRFFTCGADEVRAWTVREGAKAPQAAGVIHTDFEKGFICAETYSYAAWEEHGTEAEVKAKGKYRQEGRNYTVVDGDIMFFKFNAGAGLTGKKK